MDEVETKVTDGTVLVTGASSGLGAAIANRFAAAGATVFGTSRRALPDSEHGVAMLQLNLGAAESIEGCLAEVRRRGGDIDILINNAGVLHLGIAEETPIGTAREVLETNFFGTVALIRSVLPQMRGRRRGRIINIGSLSSWVGEPGEAFYSASKRALAGYSESLRHEVRAFGIWVSLVEPGVFRTDVLGKAMTNADMIPDYDIVRSAVAATLAKGMQTGGDPARVADVVLGVARAAKPRFRYAVGMDAHLLPYLKLVLPQRMFEYLVRRGYGLGQD